jgi:hypothetical protein
MRRLTFRVEDDGQLTMTIQLPAVDGAVVLQAPGVATGDVQDSGGTESGDPAETYTCKRSPAALADALVEVASGYLGDKVAAAANPDIEQVIVHVGTDVLDVGRRHRRPPPAMRRAVRERDGYRCQYPGCNSRHTDIHHIVPWAKGGATRLAKLASFCEAHHVIIHELGLIIGREPGGGVTVALPDGTVVPASPQLPGGEDDALSQWHDAVITDETIVPSALGDKLDLRQTIWACFVNARIAAERRAEQLAA